MLKFIPPNDTAADPAHAAELASLDFGDVWAEREASASFRLGNTFPTRLTITQLGVITFDGFPASAITSTLAGPITISPNGFSDTISVRVAAPIEFADRGWTFYVRAEWDGGHSILLATLYVLGTRDARRSEFPSRATSQTDVFSRQIVRACEKLRMYRYDPVPVLPDNRVTVEATEGGSVTFRTQCDPCQRLSPRNTDWGYRESWGWITGVWEPEPDEVTLTYTHSASAISYQAVASLILPVDNHWCLQREWAVFAPANGADKEQFKRTVFILEREGRYYCIQDVVVHNLGEIAAYITAPLIQLHDAGVDSPNYFNPFAFTYEYESDKPYSLYPCALDMKLFQPAQQGSSDSSDSSGSEPAEPPLPLHATYDQAHNIFHIEWSSLVEPYDDSEVPFVIAFVDDGAHLQYRPPPFTIVGLNGLLVQPFEIPLDLD